MIQKSHTSCYARSLRWRIGTGNAEKVEYVPRASRETMLLVKDEQCSYVASVYRLQPNQPMRARYQGGVGGNRQATSTANNAKLLPGVPCPACRDMLEATYVRPGEVIIAQSSHCISAHFPWLALRRRMDHTQNIEVACLVSSLVGKHACV